MPVLLAIVGVDVLGIGLVMPALPSLLREIGQTTNIAMVYGALMAAYAAMQFLSAPLLGRLSDRHGRRPVLVCSLAGAAIDYLVTAAVPSLSVLAAGRILAGITGANAAVAMSVIADITDPACRARRFGQMSAVAGIGLIAGPVLGGLLSVLSLRAPYLLAAGLNAASALAAMRLLPETRAVNGTRPDLSLRAALPSLAAFRGHSGLPKLVGIYATLALAAQMPLSLWILYGESRFGWDQRSVGLFLALYGLLNAIAQSILVAPLIQRFGERGCLVLGVVVNAIGFAALSGATDGWMAFALVPFWCLGSVAFPSLQAMLSRTTPAEGQGQLQGSLASLGSFISIPGPFLATLAFTHSPASLPGFAWLLATAAYLAVPCMLRERRPL